MKKILGFIIALTCLVSCYRDEDKRQLQHDCFALTSEIAELRNQKDALTAEIDYLTAQRNPLKNGREVHFIVKLKIKQGTFTLDPFEHIKNEMNSIEIEVPVSKDYYNTLKTGDELSNNFKWGSLVMDGDFSHLHIKVIGKRIE